MSIISLSVDEKTEQKIEEIMGASAYENRSELVRKAISDLHRESIEREPTRSGKGLMVVKHPHDSEEKVSKLLHSKDDIIQTQLHSKIDDGNCVEVLLVEGSQGKIQDMKDTLKGSKSTERVELLIF